MHTQVWWEDYVGVKRTSTLRDLSIDVSAIGRGSKTQACVRASNPHTSPNGTTEIGTPLATYGTCRRLC